MKPKILVVIVTFNGTRWIERCIGSVAGSSVKADILVVDNGSTDGTVEYLKGRKDVRLVQSAENLGFGAANNIGLQTALDEGYDFVYLLNQDAWLERDTLELLSSHWDSRFAVISPTQRAADGSLERKFARCTRGYRKRVPDSGVTPLRFVMAAHWMISREALLRVGGFSPVFHHYGEDDNWIERSRYFGLKAGWLPCAGAVHDRGDRQESPESKMSHKCGSALVHLVRPSGPYCLRVTLFWMELVGMALKNRSMVPLRYLRGNSKRVAGLGALRLESRRPCAFLKKPACGS